MQSEITETIKAMFGGADERDWAKVKDTMANKVLLDYSAMSGNPAAELTPEQIINTWKGLLPGFDKTHHQPARFMITQNGNNASVRYFAKADHFLRDDSWTVEANYDTVLVKTDDGWKIIAHKISDVKQIGNKKLPLKAAEIAKAKL